MSLLFKTTGGLTMGAFPLKSGIVSTFVVENDGLADLICKLFIMCVDAMAPEDVSDLTRGPEIASEDWISVRKAGDTAWVPVGFPAVWPATVNLLSDSCFTFALAAGASQAIEVRIVAPVGAETAGNVNCQIKVLGYEP